VGDGVTCHDDRQVPTVLAPSLSWSNPTGSPFDEGRDSDMDQNRKSSVLRDYKLEVIAWESSSLHQLGQKV
jgi:hypothetical protein